MKGVALLLLVAACCAEHLTKENVEALDTMNEKDDSVTVDAKNQQTNEANEKDEKDDKEPHRPALHLPSIPSFQIVPQIQFPGFQFPPIHLPQLPSLPQFNLPELPFQKKETIFKTKTLYIEAKNYDISIGNSNLLSPRKGIGNSRFNHTVIETNVIGTLVPRRYCSVHNIFLGVDNSRPRLTVRVGQRQHTHRVTKHPVCVTAYVPKPACLYDYEVKDIPTNREFDEIIEAQMADEIRPTSIISELPARTMIVESLDDSESESANDAIEDQIATYRRARYLVPHPIRSNAEKFDASNVATEPLVEPSADIKVKPIEQHIQVPHGHLIHPQHHRPGVGGLGAHQDFVDNPHHDGHQGEDHQIVHGLLKVTHLVTKTLVVTNVQKVIDHKVTATLIARNCLPSEYIIPHCDKHHGTHLFKNRDEEVKEIEVDPRVVTEDKETSDEYEERK